MCIKVVQTIRVLTGHVDGWRSIIPLYYGGGVA